MEKININGIPLEVKEYEGQRVITFKDIDRVHERPDGTARKRFNDNKKYFIENEDFFVVKQSDVQIYSTGFEVPNRGITLLTESGYLMIVKSFTDDLAWSVQRQLVNAYFKLKELTLDHNELLLMLVQKQYELEKRIEKLEKAEKYEIAVQQPLVLENNSIVFDFINECCERRCGICNNITTADLYIAFKKWCAMKNINTISKYTFIDQLCIYFQTNEKKNIRKNISGNWYYLITLTPLAIQTLQIQK
ncbi:MAG: ORF6N domain-containing protein [Ruminococcus sp.]|nr:ORF6N domain-containing protein [Ruminococcus sp.]MDE7098688.1 ORF6N domain-containing protein [Ruminococcus sp.]